MNQSINSTPDFDVIILGAGPSGTLAASLLAQAGHKVCILEKSQFPRFSIGESLLPQAMVFLEEAGLVDAVNQAGFQLKDGAVFAYGDQMTEFAFKDKFSPGPSTTFQVTRADFDLLLAKETEKKGVVIQFKHRVQSVTIDEHQVTVTGRKDAEKPFASTASFILDGSGFGRVLPRLLNLEAPVALPTRHSLFAHVRHDLKGYDQEKILISVHPKNTAIWYWLIPLSQGRASVGVVYPAEIACDKPLQRYVQESGYMGQLLQDADYIGPVGQMCGYTASVRRLHGHRYALLGNAGEFLDPIFSSGVTIALKSASLAAQCLDQQLQGKNVDWDQSFSTPLSAGIDVFRRFVASWYDTTLQDIIFAKAPNPKIRNMICSILAGYAWDTHNPYVRDVNRLQTLAKLCASEQSP